MRDRPQPVLQRIRRTLEHMITLRYGLSWTTALVPPALRRGHLGILMALALLLAAAGCGSAPFTLAASGPYVYPAAVHPSLERVAVIVVIASRSGDDLLVNPADFAARDAEHRLYAANPVATAADVQLVSRTPGARGTLPVPSITLRRNDVLTGYVVFDVPAGVRPVELVWRQTDADFAVTLAPAG